MLQYFPALFKRVYTTIFVRRKDKTNYLSYLLAHLRRKMAQLCLWTKIRTKQCLVLCTSAFHSMHAGFLCPKCDNIAWLQTRQDQNEDFF